MSEKTARIEGSFRDPGGYVFQRQNDIFRAIDPACFATLHALSETGLLNQLIRDKKLAGTQFVGEPLSTSLAKEHAGYQHFLSHERIALISYPYEWSFLMLADAALHTLDLQRELLSHGFSLKDATAYNIQFVQGQPLFIDAGSIERPQRRDLWFALGQFERMFLFPLLLQKHCGWDLRSYFRSSLHGRSLEQVQKSLGWFRLWRPSLLLDVTLPLLLERKEARRTTHDRRILHRRGAESKPQEINLGRLRSKIQKLIRHHRPGGAWTDYTSACSYPSTAEQSKKGLVADFLGAVRPQRVLDLGCNTGDYSFLAAESGAEVIAADGDESVIDLLYRRLRARPQNIFPVAVDIANPSPAIGYRNRERPGFLERSGADCLLALAVVHHLLITENFSLGAIRDLFCDLTSRYLVLEFIPPEDEMFRRLLRFRVDLFANLTLAACVEIFGARFELLRQESIAGSSRTLLFLAKKP